MATLAGTPTTPGTYGFTIQSQDANGYTGQQAFTVVIIAAPSITTTSLPGYVVQVAYSQTVVATGGTAPYTFTTSAGTIPTGLTLNSSTGVLAGTPTAEASFGFTVLCTDSLGGTASQAYTVAAAAITLSDLPTAIHNIAYLQTITSQNGVAPYTYAVTAGTLPTGLTLTVSTGVLSGTPSSAATFNFTVTSTDTNAATGSKAYALVVTDRVAPHLMMLWGFMSGGGGG